MKKITFLGFCILATSFYSCSPLSTLKAKNNSDTVTNKGWKALLSNDLLQEWHSYGKDSIGAAWTLKEGVLSFNPNAKENQKGDLVTNANYKNFHLKLDWKISKGGNSGVFFNVQDDHKKYTGPYETGPEMQVLDNDGHHDGTIIKHRASDLYDLISCSEENVKPVGSWNTAEIISDHGKLTFILNAKTVISTTMWDAQWKERIAKSKFAQWKYFGTFTSGAIVLQDHGNEVWFKNILIKELK